MKIDAKIVSSLEKVFPDKAPVDFKYQGTESVLKNEVYSFQVAYNVKGYEGSLKVRGKVTPNAELKLYNVGLVPSNLAAYEDRNDDNYISLEGGLYPDVLYPVEDGCIEVIEGTWQSIWVELIPNENGQGGIHQVEVEILLFDDEVVASIKTGVMVYDALLPKQELIHTEWFHSDCISSYYKVEPLSNEHWFEIEEFVKTATEHGINMILTPLFTPPLDTEVGGERPTVQLIDVYKEDGAYRFSFDNLKKWIDMCIRNGVEYFEMSHLFTQWGAEHAPKIVAMEDGIEKQIFGWDTDATGEEYTEFLNAFMPELTMRLKNWGIADRCYFHVSDEPNLEQIESYKSARAIIKPFLNDFKIIDALSNLDFYKQGLVDYPIPANNHIEPFLEYGIEGLWTYYCCSQAVDVSNRFMAMPSARNRILGTQLFKFDIQGFLHWGYNFYYTQYSKAEISPYVVTDAGGAFPSGDTFLVYPSDDEKAIPSIRIKVLRQALYDLRALKMLAQLTSKEHVVELMEERLDNEITFSQYPHESDYLIELRMKVNKEISEML